MIEAARRFYVERSGHDYWIEILERALANALIARAESERVRRTTLPDYGKLVPADLQERVKSAFAGSE